MFQAQYGFLTAERRYQDLVVAVEHQVRVDQAVPRLRAGSSVLEGLAPMVRFTRYLLTSLAAVAFGLSSN